MTQGQGSARSFNRKWRQWMGARGRSLRKQAGQAHASWRAVEPLEPRLLLATFTVTNTADDGAGSLRDAIVQANAAPDADVIEFNIPGAGVHTIQTLSELPVINGPVTIDGFSQPGAQPNSNLIDQPANAALMIELDGSQQISVNDFERDGLTVSASNVTVRGLAINRFGRHGVVVQGGVTGVVVAGNYIGTDVTGMVDLGNNGTGVFILLGAAGARVGGTSPADRNVISGNGGNGVLFGNSDTTGVIVQGNFIGLNAAGAAKIQNNGDGIRVNGAPSGIIGGADPQARNVISGNNGSGIDIGGGAAGHVIQGNYIGTDITGQAAVPNSQFGVVFGDNLFGAVSNHTVGGENPGEGNVIAFNNRAGVKIVQYGQATTPVNNRILGNSIHSNGELGIDLIPGVALTTTETDGVTANDDDDLDAGPNNLQNFPVLTASRAGGSVIDGTLNSTPNTTFRLEFFANHSVDATGNGEGEFFLGTVDVTTDANGDVMFNALLDNSAPDGFTHITATATDPNGSTSEFSSAVEVTSGDFIVTNTNDSGIGSLRDAIVEANAQPGGDIIRFNIPGAGPFTIEPLTELPAITDALTINGASQPGFVSAPLITLDGGAIAGLSNGLLLRDADLNVAALNLSNWSTAGIGHVPQANSAVDVVLSNLVITDIPIGAAGIRVTGAAAGTTYNVTGYDFDGDGNGIAMFTSLGTYLFSDVSLTGGNPSGVPKFFVNGGEPNVLVTGTITGGGDVENLTGGVVDIATDFTAGYILVEDNTGGVALFSGQSKVVRNAIVRNNTSNVITRITNGGLAAGGVNAIGFQATDGGFVEVSGPGNALDSTNTKALDLNNTNVDLVFQSVTSTNSTEEGVAIDDTGGTLVITGNVAVTNPATVGWLMRNSSLDVSLNTVEITGGTTGMVLGNNTGSLLTISGETLDITGNSGAGVSKNGSGDVRIGKAVIAPGTIGVDLFQNSGDAYFGALDITGAATEAVRDRQATGASHVVLHNLNLINSGADAIHVEQNQGVLHVEGGTINGSAGNGVFTDDAVNVTIRDLTLSNIAFNGIDLVADAVNSVARIQNNTVTSSVFSGIFFGAGGQGTHTVIVDGNNIAAPTDTQFMVSGIGVIPGAGATITLDIANNTSAGNVNQPLAYDFGNGGDINLVFLQQAGDPATLFADRDNIGAASFAGPTFHDIGEPFGWGVSTLDYDNDGDADVIYHGDSPSGPSVGDDGSILINTPVSRIDLHVVDGPSRSSDLAGGNNPVFNPLPTGAGVTLTLNGVPMPFDFMVEPEPNDNGAPAHAMIHVSPMNESIFPDGVYVLTIPDTITDAAGNALDGDGDGVPGGDFVTTFTVDARPEIGVVFGNGDFFLDLNGNGAFDPVPPFGGFDADAAGNLGLAILSDIETFFFFNAVAGDFTGPDGPGKKNGDGYDTLAIYGQDPTDGLFKWWIDLDGDGKFTPGVDLNLAQPQGFQIAGLPFAGNFDGNAANGDEIGLFDGTMWYLDTNGDFILDQNDTSFTGNRTGGFPVVGDWDGDGTDDLGHYDPTSQVFSIDPAHDGLNGNFGDVSGFDAFGLTGLGVHPLAGDFDGDGVDDIGIWSPGDAESNPSEQAQWFYLLSNTFDNPRAPGDLSHFPLNPTEPDLTFDDFVDVEVTVGGGPLVGNFRLPPVPSSIELQAPLVDPNGSAVGFPRIELNTDLLTNDSTVIMPFSDTELFDAGFMLIAEVESAGPLSGVDVMFGGTPTISGSNRFVIDNLSGAMTTQQVLDLLKAVQINVTRQPGATGTGRVVTRVRVTDATGKTQKTEVVTELEVNDDMTPPSVTITSPQSGVQVVEGATVPVQVDATDDVGVKRVELLVNNQVVMIDDVFPYNFDFTAPQVNSNTNFQLVARAVDTSDNSTDSAPVTVTSVNDAPPTVTITSPTQGASFVEGQMIEVAANASDDVGVTSVEFFVNGNSITIDTTAPYSAFWVFAEGETNVTFSAVVTDTANQLTNATPVDVIVTVPGQRSIFGTVFEDFDADNTIDAGDTGLANVDVILRSTDGGGVNITVQTGLDGGFVFPDPEPGEYEVEIVAPATFLHSQQAVTQVLVQDGQTIVLGGLYRNAQLHVPKWHDILGDGLDATDERLNGFEVRLYNAGNIVIGEEVAVGVTHSHDDDNSGTIEPEEVGIVWFTEIRPGFYDLVEVVPEGWLALNGEDAGTLDGDALRGHLNIEVRSGDNLTDFFFLNRPQPGLTLDYGDAPDPTYPTLRASDGARHGLSGGFLLGATVDAEGDGQPSADADGDGADEDGVDIGGVVLVPGTTTAYTVTVPATGKLDAWIDFNGDGVWSIDEKIADSFPIVNGGVGPITVPVTVSVPASAVTGKTYARFRYSRSGGLDPTGLAPNGEVEDYIVTIGRSKTEQAVIGKASPGGQTKTTLDDGNGNLFEITLKGAGQAIISQFDDNGRVAIDLVGTDIKSQLTIKNKNKTGNSIVEDLTGDGDLGKVNAKGINFFGDILIDGYVKSFTGGDVALERLIRFGGSAIDKVSKLVFGYFTNVTLISGAPIDLTLTGWADSNQSQSPDSLTAPYAKKITVKGDKKNAIAAAWQADLTLTGEGNPKQTLGGFKAEVLNEAAFDVTGASGAVAIKNEVTDAVLAFTGALKSLKIGDAARTSLSAAAAGAVSAVRWIDGALSFTDVKTIKTTGNKKTNTPGDLDVTLTVNADGLSTSKSQLGGATVAGALSGNWSIKGASGNVAAGDVTENFVGNFEGAVKSLKSKAAFNGFAAAFSFDKIDVKTTMDAATIIAGGPAGGADANFIKTLKVGGAVSDFTRILVGVDPVDGFFDNGNDVFKTGAPGITNFIKSMTIGGEAAQDSTFRAETFPKTVSINKTKVDPLTDDRFTVS